MIKDLITYNFIKVKEDCVDWKEAIHVGVDLLVENKKVEKKYEEAIIKNFNELGPYMVIAPGIVLAHARPKDGVNETAISILTLKESIDFGSKLNDPVKIVFTFAAEDSMGHIGVLTRLTELFRNKDDLNSIINAMDKETILKVLKNY